MWKKFSRFIEVKPKIARDYFTTSMWCFEGDMPRGISSLTLPTFKGNFPGILISRGLPSFTRMGGEAIPRCRAMK
jgi:hypothetical protein